MKHKYFFFLVIALLFSGVSKAQTLRHEQILDRWEFRKSGDTKWKIASVPGCVHTDLYENLLIPDPFFGNNEAYLQWIDTCDWEYRTLIKVKPTTLKNKHVTLIFQGLDTYAEVFVNGQKVLYANNMFRRWEIPCKDILKPGDNEILVHFYSITREAKRLYKQLPVALPYDERVMVRKAPYQFGWDWGPRFVTMGIWRPVILESWDEAKIEDITYNIRELNPEKAELDFICNLNATLASKYTLSFWLPGKQVTTTEVRTVPGTNIIHIPVTIEKPDLWYPRGLGEQNLYDFSLICMKDRKVCDVKTVTVGLRKTELVREDDSIGQSFYFRVNGIPVYAKGANYIPSDVFPSRKRDAQINRLLNDAVDCNMNMLRVWGGGIYEDDYFYDLCDELGIMVWQDFMFACAMMPGDSSFTANVREEVTQQVTRLRNHPSLVLWCGNNEIDEGWHNWGMQKQFSYRKADSTRIWNDYNKLFLGAIPEILHKTDTSRPYYPSSPLYGWGRSQSMTHGDAHYWGIWWGDEPFEKYNVKVPRFMSEFGFQGFPSAATLHDMVRKEDFYLFSEALQSHEKHSRGFELINAALKRDFFIPDSIDAYATVSQFAQARALQTGIEAQRRARPYCMGSLYWQLNDCWPVISWSGSDYDNHWKAAQYQAKRSFQTCILSTVISGDSIKIFGISDSLSDVSCTLKSEGYSANGDLLWTSTIPVNLPAAASTLLVSYDIRRQLPVFDSTRTFIYTRLVRNDTLLAMSVRQFCKPGNYRQPPASLTYTFEGAMENYAMITLTASKPVFGVFLETSENIEGISDNYFDLMPGEEKKLTIYYGIPQRLPLKPLVFSHLEKLR